MPSTRIWCAAPGAISTRVSRSSWTHRGSTPRSARAAARVAADTGSELLELCCTCDDSVAAERMDTRRRAGGDVSEATPQIRDAMAQRMAAWPSAITVDTSGRTPAECVSWALRELAAHT